MNITKEIKDQLNATLTLTINEQDYEAKVNDALKDYRKKAQIKGFRPGKAPLGMLQKMVGSSLLMQEIDKIVSESLTKYIEDEKLNLLGQPLPSDKQTPIDPENQKEFQLFFDIALAPEFELGLNKKIKIPFYKINVDDQTINNEIERYQNQFGKTETKEIVDEKSYIKCNLAQLDAEGKIAENGIFVENALIAVDLIKDETEKNKIIGSKLNDNFDFDLKKALPNETEIASVLHIDKEKVSEIVTPFNITINEITTFSKAQLDKELFDKVFKNKNIETEEDFRKEIIKSIEEIYNQESEFRFTIDAKEKITSKLKLPLPDEFLKKWLKATNSKEKLSDETLEKEYPHFASDLQWQIIKNKIAEEQKFEITNDEVRTESKKFTEAQFAQYGLPIGYLSDEQLAGFIDKNLEREQDRTRFAEKVIENKAVAFIKDSVKAEETPISFDEFKKLYETAD